MANTFTEREPRFGRQGGFALLIVLWGLVLLAIIVGAIGLAGRTETRIARNLVVNAQLEAAADGAVYAAMFHVQDPGPARWPADGTSRRIEVGGVTVLVTVTDEAGKINPNLASTALLAALLGAVGVPASEAGPMAQAIVDWRGGDGANAPEAAAAAYRRAGRSYLPPGSPFTSLDEVGLVLHMTPAITSALLPHLSLAQQNPMPDRAQADAVVLRALGGARPGEIAAQANSPAIPAAVTIRAEAIGPDAARFVREATVRIDAGASSATGYTILAWRSPVSR